ncbi:MAG: hypothetical protein WAW52_02175 [Methanothrix sp.]
MFFILGWGSGKARQARMHACRLVLGRAGGRSGLRARWRMPSVRDYY